MNTASGLSARTWLVWGAAATFPFLAGRNPIMLMVATLVAGAVAWIQPGERRGIPVRLIAIVSTFAILINLLTARTGNQVIIHVPDLPLGLGGPLTWNAFLFGLLSAWALLGVFLVWSTVARNVRWSSIARLLPDRLTGFAVAGNTALNLIPQTASAIGDIREAASVRGMNLASPRSAAVLFSPVINGGLDRSMHMAEVLESRGFGSRTRDVEPLSRVDRLAWLGLMTGGIFSAYGFVSSIMWAAVSGALVFLGGVLLIRFGGREPDIRRTRYVIERFSRADWVVNVAAVLSLTCSVLAASTRPDTFRYEPYPDIAIPAASALALLPILLLIAPGLIAPRHQTAP